MSLKSTYSKKILIILFSKINLSYIIFKSLAYICFKTFFEIFLKNTYKIFFIKKEYTISYFYMLKYDLMNVDHSQVIIKLKLKAEIHQFFISEYSMYLNEDIWSYNVRYNIETYTVLLRVPRTSNDRSLNLESDLRYTGSSYSHILKEACSFSIFSFSLSVYVNAT